MSKIKVFGVTILLFLLVLLGVIGVIYNNREGDTSKVKIVIDDNSVFSKEDTDEAVKVIFDEFKKYPARMEIINYDEKRYEYLVDDYRLKYNSKEVIVFYSDFVTYSMKSVSKFLDFSPSQRYSDWIWILTRNEGEDWVLREWGY